jgi:hypothetical protein
MVCKYYNKNATELFKLELKDEGIPFNIKFVPIEISMTHFDYRGPGIYMLEFNERIIYIGKFEPVNKNNILKIRWRHHLATITMRGHKVGFGKNSLLNNKLKHIDSGDLQSLLANEIHNKRQKDTGCVTSINRMRFANANWSYFETFSNHSLSMFQFHYFRICEMVTKSVVSQFEKELIYSSNPKCNKEYKEHVPGISKNECLSIAIEMFERCGYNISV